MKLSMETFSACIKLGERNGFKAIKDAGFDCVDYSFYGDVNPPEVLGEKYAEHAKEVRAILDELGLTCNQAHAPFWMEYGDPFDVKFIKYKELIRSFEAASIMGAENIVVHSLAVPVGIDVMDYNEKYYKSLEPYCKKFGIKVAIENLFYYDNKSDCYCGRIHTPEMLYDMLERLDSEWFVVCVDVGHAGVTGIEPDEMIKALDNKVLRALHIHDNDYKEDSHLFPYHGKFDWNKIMSALKEIDYQGDLTLEVPDQLHGFEVDFLPDAIVYAGKIAKSLAEKLN